jgi:Zn-dependent peptidase ImmA (M78 family)
MPEAEVKRLASEQRNEVQLALAFDVSREAMHYRLTNLGLTLTG